MGIWGSICSAVSSCASAIGSAISSCSSAIGSAISSCASAVFGVAKSVAGAVGALGPLLQVGKIAPIVGQILTAVQIIATVVETVAKIAQILQPNEKIQDIGDRALQAEGQGVTLESCNNDFDAYMAKLRSMPLDPEKSASIKEEDKWLAGSLVVERGIEEKMPQLATVGIWPLALRAPEFFTPERLNTYANHLKNGNYGFVLSEVLAKFFAPGPNVKAGSETSSFVISAEKALNPNKSNLEIGDTLEKAKEEINKDA